jgi:nucleotide-binding universal stress UspA family protein
VAGTDGSDQATRAVLWAAAEATARDQPLTVVHGAGARHARYWTPDSPLTAVDEGRVVLDRAAATVADRYPGLKVDTVLSRADPGESLLEATGPHSTLVVGSRGHGGFSSLLLGSVGLHVSARSHGPVIVVREVTEPAAGAVVVAVRDDGDRGALRFAALTAQARGASLRVVSAWMSGSLRNTAAGPAHRTTGRRREGAVRTPPGDQRPYPAAAPVHQTGGQDDR